MTNCSFETLYEAYLNQEDDLKYQIIKDRTHVRVPDKDTFPEHANKDSFSQPKDIRTVLERDGLNIHSSPDILNDIKCNSDIYILSEKLSTLNPRSQHNGVALLSEMSGNVKSITRSWYGQVSTEEKKFTWKDFFGELNESPCTPSNSAIIIDRYLFSYEKIGEYKSTYKDGLRNLKNIFEGLLPTNINARYDILVIFGADEGLIDRSITVEDLVDEIYDIVEAIDRPYEINVELLAIRKYCSLWADTHDRRIISNYFLIQAPHGFKALKANGYGTYNQLIDAKCIYNGIDSKRQREQGLVIKYCENTLSIIKNAIAQLSDDDYTCYNIDTECYTKSLTNRLLRE